MIRKTDTSKLAVPEFRSKIPMNLRERMSPEQFQIWLADRLEVGDQKMDWLLEQLCVTHNMALQSRLTLDRWTRHIESPVKLGVAILIWLAPVLLDRLIK